MIGAPNAGMIFAAGLGTRMKPLTDTRPKPMIDVAGRPLIEHALEQFTGLQRVVANTHYLPQTLTQFLEARGVTVLHEPVLLDTGGGLRNALSALGGGAVFTLNSDAVWLGADVVSQLAPIWDPARMDALLLLVPPENAVGHKGAGDFILQPDGRINWGPGQIYSGAQIIKTDRLADVAEPVFSLRVLWDRMIAEGRAFGALHQGKWCDVGHPGGIALAEAMLSGTSNV